MQSHDERISQAVVHCGRRVGTVSAEFMPRHPQLFLIGCFFFLDTVFTQNYTFVSRCEAVAVSMAVDRENRQMATKKAAKKTAKKAPAKKAK
jgi:hypothetical protein